MRSSHFVNFRTTVSLPRLRMIFGLRTSRLRSAAEAVKKRRPSGMSTVNFASRFDSPNVSVIFSEDTWSMSSSVM